MSYAIGRRCQMRPYGSPEALERRRFQAIDLLEDGLQPVEVARKLKVDRRSVRRWKAAFYSHGAEATKAKPCSGQPAKLDKYLKSRNFNN